VLLQVDLHVVFLRDLDVDGVNDVVVKDAGLLLACLAEM